MQTVPHSNLPRQVPQSSVDIVVPVFKGLLDTICCIESVLNSVCITSWRLIVVNDCSPDPEISTWLRELVLREPRVTLLENQQNQGFVASVNKGMTFSNDNDVLLLNSDTEVANDWLDRLQRAAYSEPHIGSVTPFSNNATICSYPRFCRSNDLPDSYDTPKLDALFARLLTGQTVSIPSAVGFCMYIRRNCINEVGLFDEANFGKGYGEENDFCMRSRSAGWKHLHALDTFVRHAGGVSFGESAQLRQEAALKVLLGLHPDYEKAVQAYLALDPARSARLCIDMARYAAERISPWLANPDLVVSSTSREHILPEASKYVLHVVPANGGGVDRYVRDICAQRAQDCILHVVDQQVVFEVLFLRRWIPIDASNLIAPEMREALGRPACIHAHSTLRPVRQAIKALSKLLNIDYVLTLHDTDFADASDGVDPNERQARLSFVQNAGARFVPSNYIGNLLSTVAPRQLTWQMIENGIQPTAFCSWQIVEQQSTETFQIAIIGAVGPGKGLHILEGIARALPPEVRLVVIGYADGKLEPGWLIPNRIWVHGAFEVHELPSLVKRYRAELAFFPNIRPESYCYALSDAWCAGLPALGPGSGAIGERITQCGAGWTFTPNSDTKMLADTILSCLRAVEIPRKRVRFAVGQLSSCQEMVTALNLHYNQCNRTEWLSPNLTAVEIIAATHLNGAFFRAELQKLVSDLNFAQTQVLQLTASIQSLATDHEAKGLWINKLQVDINELQGEIHRLESERAREHLDYLDQHLRQNQQHVELVAQLNANHREIIEKSRCSFRNALNALVAMPSRVWARFHRLNLGSTTRKDTK